MKKALSILPAFIFIVALLMITGCMGGVPVEYAMAGFDRAFIPAYELTSSRDTSGKSVMAVKQLKFQWSVFKSRSPILTSGDDGSGSIGGMISEADALIVAGQYRNVHKLLKKIKVKMYKARMESEIDYFPDRLYEFELVLDKIVRRPGDTRHIRALMPGAIGAWNTVQRDRISRENFRFTKEDIKRLKKLVAAETKLLNELDRAASSGDGRKTKELAAKVYDNYKKIYRAFGYFQGADIGG
jgi:hypothetical protein